MQAPICIATSAVRSRERFGSHAASPREARGKSARAARTAGARLTRTLESTAAANKRAITRASGSRGASIVSTGAIPSGNVPSTSAGKARAATSVRASPTADAGTASTRLSTISCRATRHRLAPSASRTASSRCLLSARASIRFVTFAQATSSTSPKAVRITMNIVNVLPVSGIRVARDSTVTDVGACGDSRGYRCSSHSCSHARACGSVPC